MADDDWKTRVGIEINFNSDDEENIGRVPLRYPMEDLRSPLTVDSPDSSFEGRRFFNDDILSEYADYGSTPPRTRISRRQRERKAKSDQLSGSGSSVTKTATRVIHPKATRRNTLDSIYFAELIEKSDLSSPQQEIERPALRAEPRQGRKRSMKLLRGSERDLKLEMPRSVAVGNEGDDRAESLPLMMPQPGMKVETCNRFMSLTSKLVACQAFKRSERSTADGVEPQEDRVDFYHMFAMLIRMGNRERQADKNNPKRALSREEHLWQNELKDLIWLNLQAWHAGRSPTEQDAFLCRAREGIEPLLTEIMEYRFRRKPRAPSAGSSHSQDSAVSHEASPGCAESLCCAATMAVCPHRTPKTVCETCQGGTCDDCVQRSRHSVAHCDGCLSMFCHGCNDAQESALKEVEGLLNRLEAVEALYPSSKVFALQHPLYKCVGFVDRVKAMCLWLNYTKHHRLQLHILGKLLMLSAKHGGSRQVWPVAGADEESSGAGTDQSDTYSRSSSLEDRAGARKEAAPFRHMVQFDVDAGAGSPSDSNNSNASHGTSSSRESEASAEREARPAAGGAGKNPYRKYIEEVLKTKGLRKALAFLESLHTRLLMKSMMSLQKSAPPELNVDVDPSTPVGVDENADWPDCGTPVLAEAAETRRYGFWSAETQATNVPSYRPAFLFLARIPLDVVHEFLLMRLEQKPEHPSVLSIRQLMRELKEGLAIAALHRSRFLRLIRAVAWDPDEATEESLDREVTAFDESVASILRVYLEYLRQWIDMVQQECFQKHLLEEEWLYVKKTCLGINNGGTLAATSFCRMAGGMLNAIGDFLSASVDQLRSNLEVCDNCVTEDCSSKHCMLSVCRDLQTLIAVVRCRALKAVTFAKMLRKDLEDDPVQNCCASAEVAEAVQQLKMEALLLCHSVAHSIQEMEKMCSFFSAVDEADQAALLGRTREILHQAYKFGFEYHKEVHRLATGECRHRVSRQLVKFARMWMNFVGERYERGRGFRPRWATQGLDFLMNVCEPQHTKHLTGTEFEELKATMDRCISHVIGQPSSADKPPSPLPPSPRHSIDCSRSPLPLRHQFRASRSGSSLGHRRTPSGGGSVDERPSNGGVVETISVPDIARTREERVLAAVSQLDKDLEARLRGSELIGCVTDMQARDKIHIKLRSVTFGWQRGIKIGQGSYGKVYTAVNNETGELMAVKEIALQPNDHRTIRRVAEELRIFEGIHHKHLVRYYGVEIHREEMLIFMEFCAEGTLETLAGGTEGGLPEALIRRYTRQLLQAVATLHRHGIVHRDVKSANIFLTDEGNCLKLGDFGSAVKIKAHTTVPGELQGFVGTQAYMAPEVFMKTTSEGHGRAVDIWSVGCVVVEMASGERPWAEFDSNYQIMFKVGMGETPAVPDTLSAEGVEFLTLCLRHDPRERATAPSLLQHPFSKVDGDEENLSLPLPL